jgi:predicted hydrolase (HD superfamily)
MFLHILIFRDAFLLTKARMTRQEALTILHALTESDSLLRHARSVEGVMEHYARKLGENPAEWALAGLSIAHIPLPSTSGNR